MENSRHQRETVANIARMVSTARLIAKAHEFADDVPEDVGDPLSALAEILIASLRKLQDDRTEIWRRSQRGSQRRLIQLLPFRIEDPRLCAECAQAGF
jgi:hypothetical protein